MFGLGSALWINSTQPVLIGTLDGDQTGDTTPDKAFPFARLASVTLADGSATYLYHQMNGTTLAEEKWDASLSAWSSSVYIPIAGF